MYQANNNISQEKINGKFFIVTHKKYTFPNIPDYQPIQSGSALNQDLGYLRDDTGINISCKNPQYNELDCIYWVWKNCHYDIVGFCHYRRYFSGRHKTSIGKIIDLNEAASILKENDIIVFRRRHLLMTNYRYYVHSRKDMSQTLENDFTILKQVIADLYPEYSLSFDICMKRHFNHFKNSFITTWDVFDSYCSFLFDILFEFEKRIPYRTRVCGSMGEYLMDIFIAKNKLKYKEIKVLRLEKPDYFGMLKNRLFK